MLTLLNVTRNDLRMIFGSSAVWLYVVIFPALFIVVVGLAAGDAFHFFSVAPPPVIDVIDLDSSELSARLVAVLRAADPGLIVCPAERDECPGLLDQGAARQRLQDETTQGLMEIPPGFAQALLNGDDTSIVYHSNQDDPTRPDPILPSLQAAVGQVSGAAIASRVGLEAAAASNQLSFADHDERAAFQQAVYDRASVLWDSLGGQTDFHETAGVTKPYTQNTFGQSMPGMGIYGVMVNVELGMIAIIDERKNRTLQRLAMMPVSRAQIIGGKLLAYFLMGMLVFVVSFTIGLILGVNLRGQWVAALLVMVAFTACITALTYLMAARLYAEQTARSLATLMTVALAVLGGAFMPLEMMPGWLRTLGHVSPVAWAMDGFKSLIFYGGDLNTVVVPVLVLLAMAAVLFTLAVRVFRFE